MAQQHKNRSYAVTRVTQSEIDAGKAPDNLNNTIKDYALKTIKKRGD